MGRWKRIKKSVDLTVREALKEPLNYSPRLDGITQSMLNCHASCLRKSYLSILGWKPIVSPTTYANGTIVHSLLDAVYTYYKKFGKIIPKNKLKNIIKNFELENPDWLPNQSDEMVSKFKNVAYVIVTEYLRYYIEEKDFKKMEILGAEEKFDVIWKGYRLRGMKDLRVNVDGKRWVFETKNFARINENDTLGRLTLDVQSLFYTLVEGIEYKVPVRGVIYSINRNPGHQVKKNETLQEYCRRLRKTIRRDPKHFFKRYHSVLYRRYSYYRVVIEDLV